MELYETEEQQVEALKKWWQQNGTSAVTGLIVGVAIILGWNYWQDYQKEQAAKAGAVYDQLLKVVETNKKENKNDVEKLSTTINTEYPKTEYAFYAKFLEVKTEIDNSNLAGAKLLLQEIAAKAPPELSNLAKVRLVRLMLATGEFEQGLQLINSVDPKATLGFSDNYDELVGDLYVALDRADEARSSYQKAQRNGFQSPFLQMKIDDLAAPEKIESTN